MGQIFGSGGGDSGLAEAKAAQQRAEQQAAELAATREAEKKARRDQIEEAAAERMTDLRALYAGKRGSRSLLAPGGSQAGFPRTLGSGTS